MNDYAEEKKTQFNCTHSEAELTSNRRLRSRCCTVEANYWHTRSIARPLCDRELSFLYLD